MVNFTIETTINETTYSHIVKIFRACIDFDEIPYVIPSFDDLKGYVTIIFAWIDHEAIGFIWNTDTILNEAFGMVVPNFRRQGIFSKLIAFLSKELTNNASITFYGKPEYSIMKQCANRLGYVLSNEELLMKYEGNNCHKEWSYDVEEKDNQFYYYIEDDLVGYCSLFETDSTINIYDVKILEEFRGLGYGTQIIEDVLWNVCQSGKQIILQVAANNLVAVRCYHKCDFVTMDSVVFYTKGSIE